MRRRLGFVLEKAYLKGTTNKFYLHKTEPHRFRFGTNDNEADLEAFGCNDYEAERNDC
jgi:hypothetical protein